MNPIYYFMDSLWPLVGGEEDEGIETEIEGDEE